MSVPLTCIPIAFALVFLPRAYVARAQAQRPEGYDNNDPRDQHTKLGQAARRALAAHHNGFEAFGPFAAAVLTSHVTHADPRSAAALAVAFVASRTAYPFLYISGKGIARTMVWFIGFAATIGLFVLPALS